VSDFETADSFIQSEALDAVGGTFVLAKWRTSEHEQLQSLSEDPPVSVTTIRASTCLTLIQFEPSSASEDQHQLIFV
jgi:hypothetical protein